MHVFGLTGGIASGKSTVSARFRARGLPVIDADQVAREVVAKGSEGLAEVVAAFGERVLAPDGSLDRKALGSVVFGDEALRRKLNAIVHPRIGRASAEKIAALAAAGHAVAVYDAALLVENGLADAFRPLVVVTSPASLQVSRIIARDGSTEAEAWARVHAQDPQDNKVAIADFVIDNAGSLDDLAREADRVLDAVTDRLGVPRLMVGSGPGSS